MAARRASGPQFGAEQVRRLDNNAPPEPLGQAPPLLADAAGAVERDDEGRAGRQRHAAKSRRTRGVVGSAGKPTCARLSPMSLSRWSGSSRNSRRSAARCR
jgi:hypothetical protein